MHKVFTPAIILYFLAPATRELLSGSVPPMEFFNPFGLIVLPALYGAGALLVRAARVRWTKGWAQQTGPPDADRGYDGPL